MPATHYARTQTRPGRPPRTVSVCAAIEGLETVEHWSDVTCLRCLAYRPAAPVYEDDGPSDAEAKSIGRYESHWARG